MQYQESTHTTLTLVPTKMKAIKMSGYGGPEVLSLTETAVPSIKENEVLVENYAASATRADENLRTGKPYIARLFVGFPKPKKAIPGVGFAGKVVKVGSKVTAFKIGDRVFGETLFNFSATAEFVAVAENGVILPMTDEMNYTEACTYCDGHLTSMNFIKKIAKVQKGQNVLINGASGSLGTAAVQIAKSAGAIVTAVCSTRNVKLVESLGADYVVDYTKKDFTKESQLYDVIFDTLGISSFSKCKNILTPNGQYLSPVLKASLFLDILKSKLSGTKKAVFAATGTETVPELKRMMNELSAMQQQGKLKTIIDRQFPLEKTREAHTYISAGHKRGNVVIAIK